VNARLFMHRAAPMTNGHDLERARARDALHAIPPDLPRNDWVRAGMAARSAGLDFDDFNGWSAGGSNYNERDARAAWRSFKPDGGIGAGTLFKMAADHGWRDGRGRAQRRSMQAPRRPQDSRRGINPCVVSLKRQSLSDEGMQLFSRCTGLQGTVGEQYLLARGCVVPPAHGDLRFNLSLKHPAFDYSGPALIALVTHAKTRAPLTLHRTWIRADGRKADIEPPRMLLGEHSKKHGVIRLWPDDMVTTGLAITEGIETALSVAHDYQPVWSLIDAGNLAEMPVLDGIESLVIGADNDEAGIKAANAAADRWASAGREVRIVPPKAARSDWNDLGVAT
jgi:putative DNA primase/helicase